jgi:drug/metabolite transporter (DMT)-like permease
VAFGWLLGGETFPRWSLVGGALVLAGVWMIFRKVPPKEVHDECETALPQG